MRFMRLMRLMRYKLRCLCIHIIRELQQLQISVNTMQMYQVLSQIMDNEAPDINFTHKLVTQIKNTVTQCAEETNASEHCILDYLCGATSVQKLVHLMNCSCGCRQLWRLALKEWTEAPDYFLIPRKPNCRCCLRHQRGGIGRH